jgi:mRNA interferase MazF
MKKRKVGDMMEFVSMYKRGDIFWAELSPVIGSEQGGLRPVLILQNDIGNAFSNTVIISVLTKQQKKKMPTHVYLEKNLYSLQKNSWVLLEQLRTLDKSRLRDIISQLNDEKIEEVETKLKVSLGIVENVYQYYQHILTGQIVRMKVKK